MDSQLALELGRSTEFEYLAVGKNWRKGEVEVLADAVRAALGQSNGVGKDIRTGAVDSMALEVG